MVRLGRGISGNFDLREGSTRTGAEVMRGCQRVHARRTNDAVHLRKVAESGVGLGISPD